MRIILILSLVVGIFFSGCKDDLPLQPPVDKSKLSSVTMNGTEYLTAEQVQQYYEQPNSSGLIRLLRIKHNVCYWNNGIYGPVDYSDSELTDAIFFNNGSRANIGDHFELNEMPIKQYADGSAYTSLTGDYTAPIYFGGGINRFEFMSNSLFPYFRDSLVFSSPIMITNINRLDTVHSNQDLTINWTGGTSQGKIKIEFLTSMLSDNYVDVGETTGIIYFITPNSSGSVVVPHQILQQLSTTQAVGSFYDIRLSTADPKMIVTPNNKTITVLGVSQHIVTVVLQH